MTFGCTQVALGGGGGGGGGGREEEREGRGREEQEKKEEECPLFVLEDKHGIFKATKPTGREKGGVKHDHTHLCVALIQMNGPCRVFQGGTVV